MGPNVQGTMTPTLLKSEAVGVSATAAAARAPLRAAIGFWGGGTAVDAVEVDDRTRGNPQSSLTLRLLRLRLPLTPTFAPFDSCSCRSH